jgi:hypothetical protein
LLVILGIIGIMLLAFPFGFSTTIARQFMGLEQ